KAKKYGPTDYAALVSVVTDAGFRGQPEAVTPQPGETPEMTAHRAQEAHARRARAAAWAPTFFLMQRELDGLRRYFKELGKRPRDVDRDEKVLLTCFAKAFDALNPDGTVNKAKLGTLATRWTKYIKDQLLAAEVVHTQIRKHFEEAQRIMSTPPA